MRWEAEHIEVTAGDGLHLHVSRSGSGPPLVLLHGFTGSTETWAPLRASLDTRFTTVAVDLPGHGRSESPADPARHALTRFANDLGHVLDTLGIQTAAVLGYSMGGRAALHFALQHPGRMAALVLESTSPGIDDPAERAERVATDTALADGIERDGIAAFVDRWERIPLWDSQATLPDAKRARLRDQRLANRPAGLANGLRGAGAGAQPSLTVRLAEQGAPALLVVGALDRKYVALGQLMQGAMPRAQLAIVANAGHAVHLEQPAELTRLLAHFLEQVESDSGDWSPAGRVPRSD